MSPLYVDQNDNIINLLHVVSLSKVKYYKNCFQMWSCTSALTVAGEFEIHLTGMIPSSAGSFEESEMEKQAIYNYNKLVEQWSEILTNTK